LILAKYIKSMKRE